MKKLLCLLFGHKFHKYIFIIKDNISPEKWPDICKEARHGILETLGKYERIEYDTCIRCSTKKPKEN